MPLRRPGQCDRLGVDPGGSGRRDDTTAAAPGQIDSSRLQQERSIPGPGRPDMPSFNDGDTGVPRHLEPTKAYKVAQVSSSWDMRGAFRRPQRKVVAVE